MNDQSKGDLTVAGVALRFGIVALALGTAYIHSTLGGLLFTLRYWTAQSDGGLRSAPAVAKVACLTAPCG